MRAPVPGWLSGLIERFRQSNLSTAEKTLNAYDRGVQEVERGCYAAAIRHFTEALSAAPESNKLYHHRADAFALNDRHREAIIDYDVAVRLAPGYPDTYLDRGNSRYALGDLVDAIKDFSEAIRLKPNWGEAYANRAVAYAERGDQDKSERDAATARTLGVGEIRLEEMLSAARSNLEPEAT